MLALVAGGTARAQVSPAGFVLPWNKYVPTVVPDGYTPIIGLAGTTRFGQGTPNDSKDAGATSSFSLQLPFTFIFINTAGSPQTFAAGANILVGSNGYISLSGSVPSNGTNDLSTNQGFQLIMPYWSDVQPAGVPEGGVYWRVDGSVGVRVLTVEWRVQGINAPTRNPGDFQAKLYEGSNKIVFYYGPSSINRTTIPSATAFGAAVGLKASGVNQFTNPQVPPDNDKFLLLQNPEVHPDTIAITHTRSGVTSFCPFPGFCYTRNSSETYANWPQDAFGTGVSDYWHYSFPTKNGARIGYSMSPVNNDVAADSLIFNPARTGNAYPATSSFQISGRFRNIGANSRQNVPVQLDIYRGNAIIDTRSGTAFPSLTTQGGLSTILFDPPISAPTTTNPGTYTVKLYSKLNSPTDEDRSNDTLISSFTISFLHDIRAELIINPVTFTPIFPSVYPVNVPAPIEARFLNIGTATETNVPVGYTIYDANGNQIFQDNSTIIRGDMATLEYRDVVFPTWTPTSPGTYYIRVYSILGEDQQRLNDTIPGYPSLGRPFTVQYEIELATQQGNTPGVQPPANADYPDGRPINIVTAYRNNGIVDATNVYARFQIRYNGTLVYDQLAPGVGVPAVPGSASGIGVIKFYNGFPFFVPNGPGTYSVTSIITDPQDPVRSNDTAKYTFNVKPRLSGKIFVGTGERFRTIQEANDSLYRYGISGPVTFCLIDDSYLVRPNNTDASLPALDGRGDVVGASATNTVTWKAVDGKTDVRIVLKSGSGIGIIYGQRDTSNSTGYVTWDGGPNKVLRFVMDTLMAPPGLPTLTPPVKAIPFFLTQGASNYTIKNVKIEPATIPLGLKVPVVGGLPIVSYNRGFNTFTYQKDEQISVSAGVLMRNSAPSDINGANPAKNGRFRDTLLIQNNVISGNEIRNFRYGVASIGAGPLAQILANKYVDYSNTNNSIINNLIEDVGRAGIVLAFEHGSDISNNTIRRVVNTAPVIPHAAGIWISSGGFYPLPAADTLKNRAFSSDLKIERNKISSINAGQGNGVGIWAETNENTFTTGGSFTFRFPANGATNFRIWNNFLYNYRGQTASAGSGRTAGVALTMAGDTRTDFVTIGNKVENNTIFSQNAGNIQEYGILDQRAGGTIRNNIMAIMTPATANPIALALQVRNDITPGFFGPDGYAIADSLIRSDYNIFWVPNGYVGAVSSLASNGFNIPSPPAAKTLNQWRALTKLDQNSIMSNITTDFVSTTPGSEDLHIKPSIFSVANNRGTNIAGLTTDIDGDPRGSGGSAGNYDIGADEFNGLIRNSDLVAEDIFAPVGYQAVAGQYSDAEYVMGDSLLPLAARFRNVGGNPIVSNTVTMRVDYFNGSAFVPASSNPSVPTTTTSFNVAQFRDVNFGTFAPRTLAELGVNDPFFGLNPNVTPLYRFRITSGIDDNAGNNVYEKIVRFYVPRSVRRVIASVETRQVVIPATAVGKSNKLNTDSLLMAFQLISWTRTVANPTPTQTQDYDLFDRDLWPKENLNFKPWKTVVWEQGAEPQGLEPEERAALKTMLDSRSIYDRSNLIIAGQDIARIHDVPLTTTNGQIADQDFVRNYLRATYKGNTVPANYDGRRIRGVAITAGKYEQIVATAVLNDNPPFPALAVPTSGDGIARPTHFYYEQTFANYTDSSAGVASAATKKNVVFYAIDWRHYGRFAFESLRSGGQRVLLGALDFINQYNGALPVNVVSFDAIPVGSKSVRVNWATTSETEIASLEIERAEVGVTPQGLRVGEYSVIDRKSPTGTASRGASYSTLDQNVKTGITYRYRLVSVGLDGARTEQAFDQVKILASGTEGYSLSVVPNPVRSQATINLNVPQGTEWTINLYDAAGRVAKTFTADNQATSSFELNVDGLASGAYTLRMETSTGVKLVEKVTVQK
ncbi:MAG: T9SS type A sorting domain-containing protein [Bacteroidota bacterium]